MKRASRCTSGRRAPPASAPGTLQFHVVVRNFLGKKSFLSLSVSLPRVLPVNLLVKSIAGTIGALTFLAWFGASSGSLAPAPPNDQEQQLFPTQILKVDEHEIAQARRSCELGGGVDMQVFAKGLVPLRAFPSNDAMLVVNRQLYEKAGQVEIRKVNATASLRTLCELPDWIKIKVVSLGWEPYSGEAGWVRRSELASALGENQKKGMFWDVPLDPDVREDDKQVVFDHSIAVLSSDPNCNKITSGGRMLSADSAIRYFAECSGRPTAVRPHTSYKVLVYSSTH